MKYRNEHLRDALAAEYALGTLQGRARRRFERSLKGDPRLRELVARWQGRLAPLDALVEPVQPPARVWRGIQYQLESGAGRRGWWAFRTNLGLWRALAIVSTAAAVTLAVLLTALSPTRRTPETMVVVMAGADANPGMTVSWPMHQKGEPKLRIRVFGHPEMPSGTAWELWMLPGGEQKPVSLGLIGTEPTQELTVPQALAPMIDRVWGLAMSVEPSGGSPTGQPTGPVLYKGQCTRL
ncbi:MAG TPA: anti-sigma factor [Burkholderiales bacterium]|nr:anti-sigma factor [Burkholderiales bacterium]